MDGLPENVVAQRSNRAQVTVQANGKKERWYQTLQGECLRGDVPLSLEDARRVVAVYVEHYHQVRLHSALGYVTPADKLAGHETEIFAAIRRQVTIEHLLHHLGHREDLPGSGAQRRGPCPLHGSSHRGSRSFSVNLETNLFRCFCPTCQAKGNALDLWAAVHGLPLAEAAQHLPQTFGLDLPNASREEEPEGPRSRPPAPCPTAPALQESTLTTLPNLCPNTR